MGQGCGERQVDLGCILRLRGQALLGKCGGASRAPCSRSEPSLEDGAVRWKEDGQDRPSWEPCGSMPYQAILQVGKRRFREGR